MAPADAIARALGGRKSGRGWMARCPAHDDREPGLSICEGDDGKVLVRCHAGCDQVRVVAGLRSEGLWNEKGRFRNRLVRSVPRPRPECPQNGNDTERTEAALAIWAAAAIAAGTPVAAYLASRRLELPIPERLRSHRGLKHRSGGVWPVTVGLVTRGTDDAPLAVHRTFLACDGSGKAPVDPQKMMLGPCRGGAVRLVPPGDLLMVGEGIETCLAAMQATGKPVWAALSTSGLRTLELPTVIREVIVLADGDRSGEAAAADAAMRWRHEGRRARIARPPQGMDFNDLLVGRRPRPDAGAGAGAP